MTDDKDRTKKLLKSGTRLLPLTVLVIFFGILIHDNFGGCFRLYREIGAAPWHRPDTELKTERSERWSENDIKSAMLSTLEFYEKEYYSYNGIYLSALIYNDEISCKMQDSENSQCIYLCSEIKCGYSYQMRNNNKYDMPLEKGKTITEGCWKVEHMPNGAWECRGWYNLNLN